MKLICILLLSIISTSLAAPTTQYLIYTPAATTQFIKYQTPLSTELRFQDGKQVLYYYPTPSIAPFASINSPFFTSNRYQIIALKDEGAQGGQGGFDWMGFFQNWFGGSGSGATGESPATGESGAAPAASPEGTKFTTQRFDLDKEMMKMSPEKKEEFYKKYYVITNPYYANFAPFAPVLSLSPLALSERAKETPILAEKDFKLDIVPGVKVIHTRSIPEEAPKEEIMIAEMMKEPEMMEKKEPEMMMEKKEPEMMMEKKVPEMLMEKKEPEMMMEKKEPEMMMEKKEPEMMMEKKEPEMPKAEEKAKPMPKIVDDASVAQAKPQAIAVAGEGGVASAAPVSTAIVGDGGIASSAPRATAVSGEFEDRLKAEVQQ